MIDVMKIRQDFAMLQNKQMQNHELIYFDNASTTLKPQSVIDEVVNYYTNLSANAHRGDYDLSYQVDVQYEHVRKQVQTFIHAKSQDEIVFTSGASEALNLVALGYGCKYLKQGDVVLISEAEHASNALPWMHACQITGAILQYIPLTKEGRITIENVKKALTKDVKIISLAQITNVLGFEVPIKEICELAHQMDCIVVVDAAQSIPHMPVDVQALHCDFLAFSGHKMCGPTGIGVLYGKYDLLKQMDPLFLGGGSNARFDMCGNILLKNPPFKFESGTPAIEATLGLGKAITYLQTIGMNHIHDYEQTLHQYIMKQLQTLDNIKIYNAGCESGIITFNVVGVFAQDAATFFNANGIAVRSGQHCAKLLPSHLDSNATIRASIYFYNTKEEADYFINVCKQANMENCLNVYF